MAEERGKPFVAWMYNPKSRATHYGRTDACNRDGCYEVVVTPLLPDDPKPGETWLWSDVPCEIVGAPFRSGVARMVPVRYMTNGDFGCQWTSNLRRPPVLRTVTLTLTEEEARSVREIAAGSPAISPVLAKLSEALEEVPEP